MDETTDTAERERGRTVGGDVRLAQRAGGAVVWRAVQLVGVNGLLVVRLFVLARLLAPDDFGLLAIAVTAIGVGLNLTDVGIVPALVQHPEVSDRHYDAGWTVGLVRAGLVALAVAASAPLVAALFAEPRAAVVVQVLAVRPILDALASIKTARLTRELEFRPLALWRITDAVANTVVSIALASSLGVWALVIGALAGSAASLGLSYVVAPHRPHLVFDRGAARSLLAFGRWVFATALLVTATTLIFRAAISRQLGSAALGVYFLAARLAFLPAEVAAEVVGAVTFPVYVQLRAAPDALRRAFQGVLTGLGALLLPISAVVVVLATGLTDEVLGPRWAGAAAVIQILTLAGVLGLLGEVAVPLYHGTGRPRWVALLEGVQLAVVAGLVVVLVRPFGLAGAAVAWLAAIVVSLAVCVRLLRGMLGRPFAGLAARSAGLGASAAVAAVSALGVSAAVPGPAGVFVAGFAGVSVAVVMLALADRWLALGLWADLRRVFPQLDVWRQGEPGSSAATPAGTG